MTITRSTGPADTTTWRVVGEAQANEIILQIIDFLTTAPTPFVIWDLTDGSLSKMGANDLRKIIREAGPLTGTRAGGRTAIVCANDLDFGLSRMFEAFAALSDLPFDIKVFRDIGSARVWLQQESK